MIYTNVLVPMPKKKVIFRKKANGIIYVYYTIRAYRNKAGKPTSDVVAIGRKDLATGKLFPNTRYYELFPTTKPEVPQIPSPRKSAYPKQVKTVGTTASFLEIAKQSHLLETLQKCFPDKWEKILAMASYMLSQGNVMSYIEDWFDETKVDFSNRLNDVACSRLFESITDEERRLFFKEWSKCRSDKECLVYDVTSISSYSDNIDYVEWGYNRDDDNLPQFNFGMFYGMTSGMPVYYHMYNGSVPDIACLKYMMTNAQDIGINEVCFVFDKGFASEDNFTFMSENQYSFITAMSGTRIEVANLIDEVKGKIDKMKNWIKEYDVFGIQRPISLYGLELQAHIYFSSEKRTCDLKELTSHIDRLEKELETINQSKYVTKRFKDYFNINVLSKNSLNFTLDEGKVDEKISRTGYFTLFSSNPKLTSEEVLRIYRNRNVIEKNFEQFKNRMDFRRCKTHHNRTTDGKMFTGFVALIMRSYLSQIIKKNPEMKKYTMEKVLLELKKIKSVSMSNGKEIVLTLTKTQKDILSAMKVKVE